MKLGFQGNNGKVMITADNLHYAVKTLGIPDDKHTLRRAARAFDLYHSDAVEHVDDHTFKVKSQNGNPLAYQVSIGNIDYCTCQDWMNNSGDMDVPDVHFHCKHSIAARIYLARQQAEVKYTNGSAKAKAIEAKLNGDNGSNDNGNNGNGEVNPSQSDKIDPSAIPFMESDALDAKQIETGKGGAVRLASPLANASAPAVHRLSNGEYVISYLGIMSLADKYNVMTETWEDTPSEGYVLVKAMRKDTMNIRKSCQPVNGSFKIAEGKAKRNAIRMLIPIADIRAMEHKAKLTANFDWQKAQAKCLELVSSANLNCIIHELVEAGKLRKAHPSDYDRIEWLMIHNACKDDNNDGGDNTPSSTNNDWQAKLNECYDLAYDDIRVSWLKDDMIREGRLPKHPQDWTDNDFQTLKEAVELDKSLHGRGIGHWRIEKQVNWGDNWVWARRYRFELTPVRQRCFWCESTEKTLRDFGIEWNRYDFKLSLCFDCYDNDEVTKDKLVEKFENIYNDDDTVEMPKTATEFSQKCQAVTEQVNDDDRKTSEAPVVGDCIVEANDQPLEAGNGKRKIQMDKDLKTWLVESDGTKKAISCREICEQFDSFEKQIIVRLKQAIDSGMDIATIDV